MENKKEQDFDTASLIRLRHETIEFWALMDMLDQCPTEEVLPEKNYPLRSVDCEEEYLDYLLILSILHLDVDRELNRQV